MIDKKDISYQRRSKVIPLIKSNKSTFIPKSIIKSLHDIWKNDSDGKTFSFMRFFIDFISCISQRQPRNHQGNTSDWGQV